MNRKVIPSAGPSITDEEVRLVTEAVKYGWYENMNMHIDQFVAEFSTYTGWKHCLPTVNCTSAIHLALLGLGIGPGDEVIVPDITWVASAAPISYVGATPVFCDIDRDDWCITPQAFEQSITEHTKAVVAVGLAGNIPDMDEISKIAARHNIFIIEDAAESLGAEYKGRKSGTFGDVSVFSFNATKIAIAGQGGMITTNDQDLYEKFRRFAHHGIDKSPDSIYYWSHEIGYNYNWTNIQAALALAQLRRIDELVEIKRQAHSWYRERLKDIEGIQLNYERECIKSTFWLNTIFVSPEYGMKKEKIQAEFKKYNIDARPFFYPISAMPPYAQYCVGKDMQKLNPVSYELSPYVICPPSAFCLTEEDVDYVCQCFKKILSS